MTRYQRHRAEIEADEAVRMPWWFWVAAPFVLAYFACGGTLGA